MTTMAKIPPGVGPRFPQAVVLVGATGDLARRKLLPGLFHLCSTGFIPACRIIGVSLDELDADGFRAAARSALDEFGSRKVEPEAWAPRSSGPRLRWAPSAGACTT
jgi:glucose-6-phosphate 1-dehydrogenase